MDRRNKKLKTMTIEDAMRAQNLDEFINKQQSKNQFSELQKQLEDKNICDDEFKIKKKSRWGAQKTEPKTEPAPVPTPPVFNPYAYPMGNTINVQLNQQNISINNHFVSNMPPSLYQNNALSYRPMQPMNPYAPPGHTLYQQQQRLRQQQQHQQHQIQMQMLHQKQMSQSMPQALPPQNLPQNLPRPASRPAPPPPPAPKPNKELPTDLEDYLTRGFAKCQNQKERSLMEEQLRSIVDQAKAKEELYSRNWMVFPLPSLPREKNQYFPGLASSDKTAPPPPPKPQPMAQQEQQTKRQKKQKSQLVVEHDPEAEKKKQQRLERFSAKPPAVQVSTPAPAPLKPQQAFCEDDFERLCTKWQIVGTCQNLEKEYLRLQHGVPPDPGQVRPEKVLRLSLKHLLKKWKLKQSDYKFIQDQLRSIRQDLLIQHIKNKFTVKVYETNARIALEAHDMNHFNQCQQRLYEYYLLDGIESQCRSEFFFYRLLYLVLTRGWFQLQRLLLEIAAKDIAHPDIQAALKFKSALQLGDYISVFSFYKEGRYLSSALLDPFIDKLRVHGLIALAKGLQDRLAVEYVAQVFAFPSPAEALAFLQQAGCVLAESALCTKESLVPLLDHPLLRKKESKY